MLLLLKLNSTYLLNVFYQGMDMKSREEIIYVGITNDNAEW